MNHFEQFWKTKIYEETTMRLVIVAAWTFIIILDSIRVVINHGMLVFT